MLMLKAFTNSSERTCANFCQENIHISAVFTVPFCTLLPLVSCQPPLSDAIAKYFVHMFSDVWLAILKL